jgi:hypothetical protein
MRADGGSDSRSDSRGMARINCLEHGPTRHQRSAALPNLPTSTPNQRLPSGQKGHARFVENELPVDARIEFPAKIFAALEKAYAQTDYARRSQLAPTNDNVHHKRSGPRGIHTKERRHACQ